MSDNDSDTHSNDRALTDLMTETERTAVRTLVHESITSPISERENMIDSIFSVLSHPGRRYILTYLLRSDGYATMSEIVDYVVDATDTAEDDSDFRREVTVTLTHTHLPMLDEEGFIMYNMERQLVQPTEKTKLAAPYLKIALLQRERLADLADS